MKNCIRAKRRARLLVLVFTKH